MMSLWDALRMNMMISYQELVRTFPNHLRSILDYIEQEQLTAEDRNHCMKLSKKIHREKNYTPNSKSQW